MTVLPAHGQVCWTELMTRDMEAAQEFYAAVCGWTFQVSPFNADYWVAHHGETPVAGLFLMTGEAFDGIPPHWFSYIASDDLDASVAAIEAANGVILRPPFQVGPYRIAIVRDATDAIIGFTQWVCEEA